MKSRLIHYVLMFVAFGVNASNNASGLTDSEKKIISNFVDTHVGSESAQKVLQSIVEEAVRRLDYNGYLDKVVTHVSDPANIACIKALQCDLDPDTEQIVPGEASKAYNDARVIVKNFTATIKVLNLKSRSLLVHALSKILKPSFVVSDENLEREIADRYENDAQLKNEFWQLHYAIDAEFKKLESDIQIWETTF